MKEPFAKLSPRHADFDLYCCGDYTTYGSSGEHSLEDEDGVLHCRLCGKKYRPKITVELEEVE